MKRFEGQHVLVTGAGTGIGRAIALRLAEEGAHLSLLARDQGRLEETVQAANNAGATGSFFTASTDVRDRDAVFKDVARAAGELGPLHAAVANAGVGGGNGPGFQDAESPDRFDDLVATNLGGTYHTFRAGLEHFAPQSEDDGDRRHLVAIASILARIGVMGYTGYCASKAGVTGLARAFAAELAPRRIQVNAVAPGWVDTDMAWEGIDGMAKGMGLERSEAHALAMQDVPLGRMGKPEEIAGMVAWLLSRDAFGVTGQTLDMNGGAFML